MKTGETAALPRLRKTLRWGIPFLLMPLLVQTTCVYLLVQTLIICMF